MQDHQAKIAVGEEAAEASPPVSSMPMMTKMQTLWTALFATEARAAVVMGMPMQEGSPRVYLDI
jgi:hypothetical protein